MGCNVSRLDSHGPTFPARLRPLLLQRFEEIKARRQVGRPLKDPTPSKKELLSPVDDENAFQHLLLSPNPSKIKAFSIDEDNSIKKPEPPPKGKDVPIELKEGAIAHNNGIGLANTIGNNKYPADKGNVAKDGLSIGKNDSKGSLPEEADGMKNNIEDAFTDAEDDLEEDDEDDDNERMIGYEDDEAFPGSPSFRVYFRENGEVDSPLDTGKKDGFKVTVSRDHGVPPKESPVENKVKRSKKKRSFRKVLPKNLLSVKSCYNSSHSSHDNNHLLPGKTTT